MKSRFNAKRKMLLRTMTIVLLGLPAGVSGYVYAEDMREFSDYAGMLGDVPIGMTLSISGNTIAEGRHYYYRKYLKDIPLIGTAGSDLHLAEQGGGFFLCFIMLITTW